MTYFLHYSHYLKRTRRHINRHYSCLFVACPKLLSLFESKADSSCYCNYWSYCFIAIIDECILFDSCSGWRCCRQTYWRSASVVTQNLLANALLIVTAVTPHTMARSVHSQATSDLFLSQNARIFSVGILRQHSAAPLGAWMYILHHPLTSYISHFNWNPNH